MPDSNSTRAPGIGALLLLAWPVVLSRSSQAVVGFCDAIMTAPLGGDALAATTLGALNVFCIAILPIGISIIIQSFSSQYWGRNDPAGARRYGWYGLGVAVLSGIVFSGAVGWVDEVVDQLGYAAPVRTLMSDYIRIRFASVAAMVAIEALGNWYAGLGNTRFQMYANIVVMVVNIALNWLLIEGHWGAPAWGVNGAAVASVTASWVGAGILLVLFVRRAEFPRTAPTPLSAREFGTMLRYGIPNGLNWFMEFAAFMLFLNVIVADLGTVTSAAMAAVIQVNSVSFMPAFGIATAGAILAGQAIGSDRRDQVPIILRRTLATACAWQGSVGLLYVAAPETIMGWFAPEASDLQAELVSVGAVMLALSAAWQLFDAAGIAFTEILRAAGDTAFCMWARLLIAWAIFLPGAYVAVTRWNGGAVASISAIIAYLAVLSAVLFWRFRSGAWRRIALSEPPLPPP